jgi:hypothetical protein
MYNHFLSDNLKQYLNSQIEDVLLCFFFRQHKKKSVSIETLGGISHSRLGQINLITFSGTMILSLNSIYRVQGSTFHQ